MNGLLGFLILPLILLLLPVDSYAGVSDFQVKKVYTEYADFTGKVERGDSGLVTIVIYDENYEFISKYNALIKPDYTFEQSIKINDILSQNGNYKATAFVNDLMQGETVTIKYPLDSTNTFSPNNEQDTDTHDESLKFKNRENEEKLKELAPFVDPQKDPKHYLERYYNEPRYKEWFDRNYPDRTIEEAVGYQETTKVQNSQYSIISDAEAMTDKGTQEPTNNEIAQLMFALGGLGILFSAVYGIKRKVDHNSRLININRHTIKNKIIKPLWGQNSLEIIQIRLAKGEITPHEYDELKTRLGS